MVAVRMRIVTDCGMCRPQTSMGCFQLGSGSTDRCEVEDEDGCQGEGGKGGHGGHGGGPGQREQREAGSWQGLFEYE